MANAQFTLEASSSRTRLFVAALRAIGYVTRPFNQKGVWHFARYVGPFVDGSHRCTVPLGDSSRFAFFCRDPYWSRLIAPAFVYEPEIHAVLDLLKHTRYGLLDCGANFGYWSVAATDPSLGCTHAVAVEASPATFENLARNHRLNGQRFTILNRAIFSETGQIVQIEQQGHDHAAAELRFGNGTGGSAAIETITIDDVVRQYFEAEPLLVIKLDVEGVEIAALRGARTTLNSAVIVMYEDHGHDPSSKVTAFIIGELGLGVYFRDDAGRFTRVGSAAEASSLKLNRKVGYNFFAVTPAAEPTFASLVAVK